MENGKNGQLVDDPAARDASLNAASKAEICRALDEYITSEQLRAAALLLHQVLQQVPFGASRKTNTGNLMSHRVCDTHDWLFCGTIN